MAETMEQAIWRWAVGISGGNSNPGWQYEAGMVFVTEKGRLPCTLAEWTGWLTAKGILPPMAGYDRNPMVIINPQSRQLRMAPYPPVACPDGSNGCSQTPWAPCGSSTPKPPSPPPPATGGTPPATGGTPTIPEVPSGFGDLFEQAKSWAMGNPMWAIGGALGLAWFLFGGKRR